MDDLQEKAVVAQEEKARADGWVPLEEWDKDPGDWVPASEFNFRGELMKRIQSQTRALNQDREEKAELKKAIADLKEHNKKIAENERKKVLAELKAERRRARREGDDDLVDEIEDRMEEVREMDLGDDVDDDTSNTSSQGDLTEAQRAAFGAAFQAWVGENDWYANDVALQGVADAIGMKLATDQPEYLNDPAGFYAEIGKRVKKEMPHKFSKPKPSESDVTEPTEGRGGRKGSNKASVKLLTPEQRQVGERFVRTKAMESLEEYAQSLYDIGELGNE